LALLLTPATALLNRDPKITETDKQFAANYPEDKRPVAEKGILDKLRGPGVPYPALQNKDDFDRDFVQDENADKGAWQAQFEYDALRKKLAAEEAGVKRAEDRASREGRDADAAQRDDDEAGGRVRDAQKGADDAGKGEDEIKRAEDFDGPPSDEKLKELKKAVDAAEERFAKEKKEFEECERQLAEAKKDIEDLKAMQTDLEGQIASETKLWVEQNQKQKTVKFNLKKTKENGALEKTKTAMAKLAAAEKVQAEAEKALAKEKGESEASQKKLQKEKADLKKVQDQLAAASTRLQNLHGYKPVEPAPALKSGAESTSIWQRLMR